MPGVSKKITLDCGILIVTYLCSRKADVGSKFGS